jgi:hypothetical protein
MACMLSVVGHILTKAPAALRFVVKYCAAMFEVGAKHGLYVISCRPYSNESTGSHLNSEDKR